MSQIPYSSIPTWAQQQSLDESALPELSGGRDYLIIGVVGGVDDETSTQIQRCAQLLGATSHTSEIFSDVATAADFLSDFLAQANVGLRVVIVAQTGVALALRGVATSAGLMDDEIQIVATGVGQVEIFCPHCSAATTTEAGVGEVVDCATCGRHLVIYHHVSRRTGRYLGYMVDAETAEAPISASASGSTS